MKLEEKEVQSAQKKKNKKDFSKEEVKVVIEQTRGLLAAVTQQVCVIVKLSVLR